MEHCELCKEEGRGLVVAHYKGVPAAQSHTGRAIPPLCWHHKNNKPRPNLSGDPNAQLIADTHEEIARARQGGTTMNDEEETAQEETERRCTRGCGKPPHRGLCKGQTTPRNHRPTVPTPERTGQGTVKLDADHIEVLARVLDKWWEELTPFDKVKVFSGSS